MNVTFSTLGHFLSRCSCIRLALQWTLKVCVPINDFIAANLLRCRGFGNAPISWPNSHVRSKLNSSRSEKLVLRVALYLLLRNFVVFEYKIWIPWKFRVVKRDRSDDLRSFHDETVLWNAPRSKILANYRQFMLQSNPWTSCTTNHYVSYIFRPIVIPIKRLRYHEFLLRLDAAFDNKPIAFPTSKFSASISALKLRCLRFKLVSFRD